MEERKIFQAINLIRNMEFVHKAIKEEDDQLIALLILKMNERKGKELLACFDKKKAKEIKNRMKETDIETVSKKILLLMEKNIQKKLENEILNG